ncbi:hypothetical protein EJB05_11077, partial [Eragrostis curvula]
MVSPFEIRHLYGDVVETATIVRCLLEPVAAQLSGDPSTVHRRCVFGRCLDRLPDAVRDDLAPFGSVEAVALGPLFEGVVVFRDEASVAVALRRRGETRAGWFTAVPALDAALPIRYFPQTTACRIHAALYPPSPADAARTQVPPRPLKPLFTLWNSPHEHDGPDPFGPKKRDAGTTRFVPSRNATVFGPLRGVDGHLWMDGHNLIYCDNDVVREDPSWIRVAPLEPTETYGGPPPKFVPLFSVGI